MNDLGCKVQQQQPLSFPAPAFQSPPQSASSCCQSPNEVPSSNRSRGSPGGSLAGGAGAALGPSTSSPTSSAFGLYEDYIAAGFVIAPDVNSLLSNIYTYTPSLSLDIQTVMNNGFVNGCQKGFRALRYCSLAASRIRSLLSYASFIFNTLFRSFLF